MHSILLLPGLASDATLWRDQTPALSAQHRVAVSDVHFRFDTLPAMAAALLEEHPGRHVLVGSSMGGMLALEAWRQAPERVSALALLGSTARPDTAEQIRLRSQACELFEQGRMDEVLRANLGFVFHPRADGGNAALSAAYLEFVSRAGAAQLIRQNHAVMARPDYRPRLRHITCPLLVVCGESDLLTPPECSREIAAAVPQARLELLAECGHLLTMEQPARVNALLLEWLGSLSPYPERGLG